MWTTKMKLITISLWNRQIDHQRAKATKGAVVRLVSTEDEAKLNGILDQAPHLVEKWWLIEKVEKWKEIRLK